MDTPQDMQTTDITNAVARWFSAVDRRDWTGAQALMTPEFDLDYSSFGGGPAATRSAAGVLADWAGRLPGFDATHHQIGNLDVRHAGRTADVRCLVTASHYMASQQRGPVWTVVGRYELALIREDDAWRLSGCRFLFKYQDGNDALPALAQQRVKDRAARAR